MKNVIVTFTLCIAIISMENCEAKNHFWFNKNGFSISPSMKSESNALDYKLVVGEKIILQGQLGLALPSVAGAAVDSCDPGQADQCYQWGDYAQVLLTAPADLVNDNCARIEWVSTFARRLEDCFELMDGVHWYGGGETRIHSWPIEVDSQDENPFVTGDFVGGEPFGGVMETYWLTSTAAAIHVDEDTPLFTSWNTTHPGKFCLVSQDQSPYTKRNELRLRYDICAPKEGENLKNVHLRAFPRYYAKPIGIPDEDMIVHPWWSTWAQYRTSVNQTIVIDLAKRIIAEGYLNNSHLEIDDNWEKCYGDAIFNSEKFPDPAGMVAELANLGITRTTVWIQPFVNFQCESFAEAFTKGYFVQDEKSLPAPSGWWGSSQAAAIDFSNPDAANWWVERLKTLQNSVGITSFKFDGGEASYLPASLKLKNGDSNYLPNLYSSKYVEAVGQHFPRTIETRTAHRNQDQPIFIRFLDRTTRWDNDNGLRSLIPSLLQFSVLGYSFALPDMMGGNGDMVDTELYIRWAQLNVFLPSWQFSVNILNRFQVTSPHVQLTVVPWDVDPSGVRDRVVKEAVQLRERYGEKLLAAARLSVQDGTPMNRPLWWSDPDDPVTYNIGDQFMLGDDVLVAPVLYQGAVSRNIYLPKGTWSVGESDGQETYEGPLWLQNWPAPIDVLPFFEKIA